MGVFLSARYFCLFVYQPIVSAGTKYEFEDASHADQASRLLGCKTQTLVRAVFYGTTAGPMRARAADTGGFTARDLLEGFVCGMYQDLFNALLLLINR